MARLHCERQITLKREPIGERLTPRAELATCIGGQAARPLGILEACGRFWDFIARDLKGSEQYQSANIVVVEVLDKYNDYSD
eukprot:gene10970-3042_t